MLRGIFFQVNAAFHKDYWQAAGQVRYLKYWYILESQPHPMSYINLSQSRVPSIERPNRGFTIYLLRSKHSEKNEDILAGATILHVHLYESVLLHHNTCTHIPV